MGNHISNKYTLVVVSEYHNDHLGTPLALSDKDGVVVAEWKRDPFGMVVSKTGSVDDNNMFPGQFWDADAGLAYNWNRWYSPEIGRYVEVDPLLQYGVDVMRTDSHSYAYASNNPLLFIDPLGLEAATPCGAQYTGVFAGIPGFANNLALYCAKCPPKKKVANVQISGFASGSGVTSEREGGRSRCSCEGGQVISVVIQTRNSLTPMGFLGSLGSVSFDCKCEQ